METSLLLIKGFKIQVYVGSTILKPLKGKGLYSATLDVTQSLGFVVSSEELPIVQQARATKNLL